MSNRNKLLISFDELRENSRITGNVQPTTLRPIVLLSQETDLQPLIGEALYEYLLAQRTLVSTFTGLTSIMEVFVDDFMKPFMYHACEYEFLYSNMVTLDEIGVNVPTGPNTKETTDKEIDNQRKKAQSTMNFYAERLRTFICKDTNWPTFSSYFGEDQQNIYPVQRINKGGIYFPEGGEKWSNWKKYDI